MNYVEWLRARRVLIGVGIALGVLLLAAIVLRIVYLRVETTGKFISAVSTDPGTTRHDTTLPDGTRRTVIDDPAKQVHIVIDDSGYQGKTVTIDQPKKDAVDISHDLTFGSMSVTPTENGSMERITIRTNNYTTFAPYLAIAWFFAMIVATILGAPFARENDGHLEYALMKPASRIMLALSMIGVDVAAIVGTIVGTVLALMLIQVLFEPVHLSLQSAVDTWASAIFVPLGWYALLNALTASMRRASGVVLGLSWPVLFSVNALAAIPWDQSVLGRVCWFITHGITVVNPISYLSLAGGHISTVAAKIPFATGATGILIAFSLVIVYSALAVLQWRRVEA